MELLAVTNEGEEQLENKVATIEYLVEKLYDNDNILVESMRINHFLTLIDDLKNLITSMDVDYILIVNSAYIELSFTTKIYNSSNYDLVFSNLFVGTFSEWRKVIGSPQANKDLSYEFPAEEEPTPYCELSYCEFIASVLEINELEIDKLNTN